MLGGARAGLPATGVLLVEGLLLGGAARAATAARPSVLVLRRLCHCAHELHIILLPLCRVSQHIPCLREPDKPSRA